MFYTAGHVQYCEDCDFRKPLGVLRQFEQFIYVFVIYMYADSALEQNCVAKGPFG